MQTFTITFGDSSVALPVGETLIGRGQACGIRFADLRISRHHLKICVSPSHALVEDLGSANGTHLNGKPLQGRTRLADGDELVLGGSIRLCVWVEEGLSVSARETAEAVDTLVHNAPMLDHVRTHDLALRASSTGELKRTASGLSSRDRRKHARTIAEAAVSYDSETLNVDGRAQNVSDGGIFVVTELLDQVGTCCEMTIRLASLGRPMRARGIVRHVVLSETADAPNPPGMGIEFTELRAG